MTDFDDYERDYLESSGKNPQTVTSGISQKNSWGIVEK